MSIGGSAYGEPVLAKHSDGHLEVFVVGLDGHMYRKPQAGPGQRFVADWIALDTQLHVFLYEEEIVFDPLTTRIAWATHQNGNMYIFARTARGRLVYTHTGARPGYSEWKSIAALQDGHPALGNPTAASAIDENDRMTICVRAKNGNILSKSMGRETDDWGDPNQWTNYSGIGSSEPVVGKCGVSSMVHTSIYVRALDNNLCWIGEAHEHGTHTPFGPWRRLFDDGNSEVGAKLSGQPVITLAGTGVVWRGMDGNLWTMRMPGGFGNFDVPTPVRDSASASDPVYVGSILDTRWSMFWQSPGGRVMMQRGTIGGDGETPMPLTESQNVRVISKPSAAMSADGRLEVVFLGSDSAVYHLRETSPGSGVFNEGA